VIGNSHPSSVGTVRRGGLGHGWLGKVRLGKELVTVDRQFNELSFECFGSQGFGWECKGADWFGTVG
jgi:hypothetical protein